MSLWPRHNERSGHGPAVLVSGTHAAQGGRARSGEREAEPQDQATSSPGLEFLAAEAAVGHIWREQGVPGVVHSATHPDQAGLGRGVGYNWAQEKRSGDLANCLTCCPGGHVHPS